MKAKDFYETIAKYIKAPTDRKIINAARKHGLYDKRANVMEYTGLNLAKATEFGETIKQGERHEKKPT